MSVIFRLVMVAAAGIWWCAGAPAAEEEPLQIGKDRLWNAPRPEGPDLSVQFISRTPRLPGLSPSYVKIDDDVHGQGETGPVTLEDRDRPGWPRPGQEVTFTALVRNAGSKSVKKFQWHWLHDGRDVKWGEHDGVLEPDGTVQFVLKRKWEPGRHFIAFQVDRHRLVEEACEENNWVIDRTDALSFAFFVEESVREYFKTVRNGLGSYDWADWAQFQVRQMNKEFRDTIYPSCPGGIEERVRLDAVHIIPDGWGHLQGMHTPGVRVPVNLDAPELCNANDPTGGSDSSGGNNSGDGDDSSGAGGSAGGKWEVFTNVNGGVDGVWGFTADLLKADPNKGGKNFYEFMPRWLTGSEWPLHHELGHQLGRIDNYLIVADGKANAAVPGLGYNPPEDFKRGMMSHGNYAHDEAIGQNTKKWDSTYRFYSEFTARSFNRDKGVRRGLFGEYLFDVPTKNTFTFLGPDGGAVMQAAVEVFVGRGRGYTACGFNGAPNFTGVTDGKGVFVLDGRPWDHVFIWGNNGVVLFRVTQEGRKPLAGFLDISHFNLAYWRSSEADAHFIVKLSEVH